jgi:hypothetical protein
VTIEAGVLSLKITETGADAVEKKLKDIDTQAQKLGGKPINIPVASGALLDRQLQQMGQQITLFKQGAQSAGTKAASLKELGSIEHQLRSIVAGSNTTLEQRVAAEKQLGQLLGGRTAQTRTLTSALGAQVLTYLSFAAAERVYDTISAAADRQETAQRKLSATSRLTGVALANITAISDMAQDKFKVSASVAADLTQGFVKLAARTGDVSKAGALMTAWMDLGKAQGLSLDQILTGLNSTLVGQDEGLNRLGLMNPSNIWKQWADAAGRTVASMSDQEKWLAIVNAAIAEGAKVNGEYNRSLETTQGKQDAFNQTLEKTFAAMGKNISGTREWWYTFGTALGEMFLKADKFFNRLDQGARDMDTRMLKAADRGFRSFFGLPPIEDPAYKPQGPPISGKGSPKTPPHVPTAAEIAAAKKIQEKIEKALGINLDHMGVTGLINTTPPPTPTMAPTVGVDKDGKMKGVAGGPIAKVSATWEKIGETIKEKNAKIVSIAQDSAFAIGNAFGDAFTAAFSGDDNFFAALGKSLLKSLGNILVQLGSEMIAYGAIMGPLGLLPGPWMGLGLGAAASAAAGIGLIALGAGMGAIGGGGGKGGGGGGGASPKPEQNEFAVAFDPDNKLRRSGPAVTPSSRGLSNAPMPEGRPTVVIGTINSLSPDDAKWQRAVADTYNNARNRGLVRNG